jgi:indole-3-acetate monooxygenase
MTYPRFPEDQAEKRTALLKAVENVRETLTAYAGEAEQLATLPSASVQALRAAGLFTLKLPAELGGAEADPVTQLEVLEALAYIDASAGWCTMIGATGIALPGAFLAQEAVDTIFKDGHIPTAAGAIAPSGRAQPVKGGYRLSGRWQFASGIRHAEWLSAGGLVTSSSEDALQRRLFVFPAPAAKIHDNWQVAGLKGTGSCDFSVTDLFVPSEFTFAASDFSSGLPKRGGPLYRLGSPGFVANEHAAFALGVARRALDSIADVASVKRRGPGTIVADRPVFLASLGECELQLRAARAFVMEVFEKAWQTVYEGNVPEPRLQAEMRAAAVFATEVAVDVTTRAFRFAGGSALQLTDILQRCLRDINAGAQHYMVSNDAYEYLGRFVAGLPDAKPMG